MEVRQWEMLLTAAEHGSYSRAGEALHISHSAIHRQVRLLARDVGDRLLVRVGRGVQLTETGQLLCDLMRTIGREIRDARRRIEDLQRMVQMSGNAGVLTRHRAITSGLQYLRLKESKIACQVWLVSPAVDRLPRAARVFCHLCRRASRTRHGSPRNH